LPRGLQKDICQLAALDIPSSCVRVAVGFDRSGLDVAQPLGKLLALGELTEWSRQQGQGLAPAALRQVRYIHVPLQRGASQHLDFSPIF
jgi:hypothetical protein